MRLDWWWITILVLCGSFQIYRGAPIDGVFFLGAGLALLADAAGWLRRIDAYPLPRVNLAVLIVLGVVVVAIITVTPQFSVADVATVSVIGATALIVAWRDAPPRPKGDASSSSDDGASLAKALRRSAWLWAATGVFLCLWELSSFFLAMPSAQAENDHPPLSDLIDPIVANPIGRAILAAVWVAAGIGLLQRGRMQRSDGRGLER